MPSLNDEATWPREILDRDYNARASVPPAVFEEAIGRYRSDSEKVAGHLDFGDVVYDEESGQTLDIYGAGKTDGAQAEGLRPVFVFIHGGYWRLLSKQDSAFMAAMLDEQGIATAVVDYRLAPAVSLHEIVREVRAAIAFLWHQGRSYGLDPERIYVGGSSAGGHLAAAVVSGGWHEAFDVPSTVVKGAMPLSGLFHLGPIAHSFVQEWLSLDADAVEQLSPAELLPDAGCPLFIAYAQGEPAGFKRQSQAYARLWQEAGFPAQLVEVEGRNHFDLPLDLMDPDSELSRALIGMINR
ncbi:alpha/beta hydrolase [Pseudohoeflea coraliihabitans]|uniref:Alpha/beta hydrolase n=1 Tax=Pseudohoeflea coraliihabitans TaxID=2860393 RepID=A0ABS6WKF7_9HYPH|nr:alpha/beta hydrolase [Pseudohoeflea sp. DP4N28-3]MBW3096422.1 alpha/beta hydrolase [Pseudohoeflea sp. DP4N28-3]